MILIPATGGPSWADILTAIGTIGAVVVAVWVTLRSDRKTEARLREEREYGRAQVEEERRIARDREQLAEAYAVQVVTAEVADLPAGPAGQVRVMDGRRLAVLIVNRGSFTITRVEAQFSLDGGSLISHHSYERVPSFESVPTALRAGWGPSEERAVHGVLTPWDTGHPLRDRHRPRQVPEEPLSPGAVD